MTAKKSVISNNIDDCILHGDEHLEFMRRLYDVDKSSWEDIMNNPESHAELRKDTLDNMSQEKLHFIGEMVQLSSSGVSMKDVKDGIKLCELSTKEADDVTVAFVNAAQLKPSPSMQEAFTLVGKSKKQR